MIFTWWAPSLEESKRQIIQLYYIIMLATLKGSGHFSQNPMCQEVGQNIQKKWYSKIDL